MEEAMRSLVIMRHAKASFKNAGIKDGKRPLTKKGEKSAAEIANKINERELFPQMILTSTAIRAIQTAEIVAKIIDFNGEIQHEKGLYMAEADEIIKILRELPDELERVLVIGHNPGLESMIPMLTDQIKDLPTAGVAYLSLPISHWKELNSKTEAELVELWRPQKNC